MRLTLTESMLQELMLEKAAERTALYPNSSPLMPGNTPIACLEKPQIGKLIQQYQQHEHFNIAIIEAELKQDLELITENTSPGINMNFMLSGRILTRFAHLPHDINLTQARHNLLYLNNGSGLHIFQKGHLFQNLHINLSEAYFKALCPPASIGLERFHNHMLKQHSTLASQQHGYIDMQMQSVILGMLNSDSMGALQKLYMEAKVLELLALQLNQFEVRGEQAVKSSNTDKTLAEEIRLYLHLHYLDPPSLKELARIFCTNEFRLKKVFREHVGKGVFNYAQQLRLQHAHDLFQDRASTVSEVAQLLGYSHAHHLSAAFKKQFGYSPSSIK